MVWVWAQIGRKMLGSASHCTSKTMTLDMILEVPWDGLGTLPFWAVTISWSRLLGWWAKWPSRNSNHTTPNTTKSNPKPKSHLHLSQFLSPSLFLSSTMPLATIAKANQTLPHAHPRSTESPCGQMHRHPARRTGSAVCQIV